MALREPRETDTINVSQEVQDRAAEYRSIINRHRVVHKEYSIAKMQGKVTKALQDKHDKSHSKLKQDLKAFNNRR